MHLAIRGALAARQSDCYINEFGDDVCHNHAWYGWARWLVLGLVILGVLALFFLFSCVSARRRRRYGHAPYRGTGWAMGMAPGRWGGGNSHPGQNVQPQYETNNYNPATGAESQQPYYAAPGGAQGYYGNTGVAPPGNTYQPPSGPPPFKH